MRDRLIEPAAASDERGAGGELALELADAADVGVDTDAEVDEELLPDGRRPSGGTMVPDPDPEPRRDLRESIAKANKNEKT